MPASKTSCGSSKEGGGKVVAPAGTVAVVVVAVAVVAVVAVKRGRRGLRRRRRWRQGGAVVTA